MRERLAGLSQQPLVWFSGLFLAVLAVHGIGYIDIPDYLGISQDMLHVHSPPERQFLYYSPVNYFLAHALGLISIPGFFGIHIAEIVLMLGAVYVSVSRKIPVREERILFFVLLALTPIWLVSIKWIGKPDALLFALLFLCWGFPGYIRWIAAALLVIVHRELGVFICFFFLLSEDKPDYSFIASAFIGLGFHGVYENLVLHAPKTRFQSWAASPWMHPAEFIDRPVLYLFGSLSCYWLVVLWEKPALKIALSLLLAFGIAMMSEDFTRDFILMAMPAILAHTEKIVRLPTSQNLIRFAPLCVFQIQVALKGQVYKPENFWVEWYNGHFWQQFITAIGLN